MNERSNGCRPNCPHCDASEPPICCIERIPSKTLYRPAYEAQHWGTIRVSMAAISTETHERAVGASGFAAPVERRRPHRPLDGSPH